ncbi:MAG TPA: Mur ligase domain-containing protein, partial [Chitinophagaceae bacterium]|nr:Mur ligase domain-containing protein [Chitinophagaceae bacterium]
MIDLLAKQRYFFIGVAGAGMSAIAQYLAGNGKTVSGSDRLFLAESDDPVQKKLEEAHIQCFIQDGSGLDATMDYVIVSTAIEETNPEIQKARLLNIPVVLRADLLAAICKSKRTIAIAGTSGKSSVTAMLYHILEQQGLGPSLISGAGLVDLQRKGKIGNAACGDGEWLLIEADESDGTLVKYEPEIGLLLSIDKDHKEISELMDIFTLFRSHCSQHFIVNRSHPLASSLTTQSDFDFGKGTLYEGHDFVQEGFSIQFRVAGILVSLPAIGLHSMENALACMAVAGLLGV